jgi:hypothetical protein
MSATGGKAYIDLAAKAVPSSTQRIVAIIPGMG